MKAFLRRVTVPLFILGGAGFIGSQVTGYYLKQTQAARTAVILSMEKSVREDWFKQKAALDAAAAKHPGEIAPLPLIGNAASIEAHKLALSYDARYYRLARWQQIADVITVGSFLLALFSSTALALISRRETSNDPRSKLRGI
jgi:hypothetical protein